MSDAFDSVVIGAGINGLTAAAYLARGGRRVLVVEADETIGGLCQPMQFADGYLCAHVAQALYALDPKILKDFKPIRKALTFAIRDLPLIGVDANGTRVSLSRDVHASARSIAALSQADAEAWPRFRREFFGLARAMRKLWWDDRQFETAKLSRKHQALLAQLQVLSAAAWLDDWFESDLLKATLALDLGGASPLEPGSALTLVWRAAQEMCGLQGAVAIPKRSAGAVTGLLVEAATAAGAVVRNDTRVRRIVLEADRVTGVEVGIRETIACRQVLSSLSRSATLLGLAPEAVPFAAARELEAAAPPATGSALVALALNESPRFGDEASGRFIRSDNLENHVAAEAAARAGMLPDDLICETIVSSQWDSSVAPPGCHVVTCLVRPVPRNPSEGWNVLKPKLTAKVIAMLDRLSPGLVPAIVSTHTVTPDDMAEQDDAASPERMLASWRERIQTPIAGLFLCGVAAEPVAAASGRGGRIAAAIALETP